MTKEEKIKEGIYLTAIDNCIIPSTGYSTLTIGKTYKVLGVDYENDEFFIENDEEHQHYFSISEYTKFFESLDKYFNNGWVKIESEADLPKESGLYWAIDYEFGNDIAYFDEFKKKWMCDNVEYFPTHYQPIEIPKPPIY